MNCDSVVRIQLVLMAQTWEDCLKLSNYKGWEYALCDVPLSVLPGVHCGPYQPPSLWSLWENTMRIVERFSRKGSRALGLTAGLCSSMILSDMLGNMAGISPVLHALMAVLHCSALQL